VSVGLVFFRDFLNQTIDGAEKVKDLGYPLLAVIPNTEDYIDKKYNGKKKTTAGGKSVSASWVSLLDSISPIAESYRRLHNNIIYSHPDESFQVMLITSSNQGEGKTTVTSNLAVALAESGKKVLVLDADLRRPAVHSFMGEKNSPGLMEILFDDLTLEEGIKQTLDPNVDVITAGRRPPNPSAVLHSRKFEELFSQLRGKV
jgi:Mrp family chromosome partitioning ATPase